MDHKGIVVVRGADAGEMERWVDVAARAGLGIVDGAKWGTDFLLDVYRSGTAPFLVLIGGGVVPYAPDEMTTPILPDPQAILSRDASTGFINPYAFTDAGNGRAVYGRGYPFALRQQAPVHTPARLPDPPPPLDLYSYIIGGVGDWDAPTRLLLSGGATRCRFPEEGRLTGAAAAPFNYFPVSCRAVMISRRLLPYYPISAQGLIDLFGPFCDVAAGYVAQVAAHCLGWHVGFGGPPLPRTARAGRALFGQAVDEAHYYGAVEDLCESLPRRAWKQPLGELQLELARLFGRNGEWGDRLGGAIVAWHSTFTCP